MNRLYRCLQSLARPVRENGLFCLVMLAMHLICVWQMKQWRPDFWPHMGGVVQDLYVLCLVLWLLPKKWGRGVKGLLYVIAYLTAAFEVFLYLRFRMNYTPTALQLWAETTPQETGEFFAAYLHGPALRTTLLCFGALLAAHLLCLFLMKRQGKAQIRFSSDENGVSRNENGVGADNTPVPCAKKRRARGQTVSCLLLILVLVAATAAAWTNRGWMWKYFTNTTSTRTEIRIDLFYSPVWRLAYSAKMLHLANGELGTLRRNMAALDVDSCTAHCPNIVLIVGESYNKHHSQLYGYSRATTPWQQEEKEAGRLVAFSDAVACWNLTSNVFKYSLSTQSMDQEGAWCDGVLYPALFRKAGYRVAFLTNQFLATRRQHSFDFNGSFFLNDPQLDSMCFDFRNRCLYRYDRQLVKEYRRYNPGPKNLVIFHLFGQHQKYSYRLTKSDRHFTADSIDRPDLSRAERQTVADYDNATRCNDDVIRRICQLFKDDDAIVVHYADHGEHIYDDTLVCGRTGANPPSPVVARHQFEVPMTIWFSEKFKMAHPDVVAQVHRAKDKPFMTDDMPHLMLGLAGIACPYYDPRRDILDDRFDTGRPRLIKRQYDYDRLTGRTD